MPAKKKVGTLSKKTVARPERISFHFLKSTQHRVIHVDGAFGAVTPHGLVSVSLFSERFPIPVEETHSLIGDGSLKAEAENVKGKTGIVREIDVTAILSPDIARRIADWLINRANDAERLAKQVQDVQYEGNK